MKTICTLLPHGKSVFFYYLLPFFLFSHFCFAQPDYDFRNPVLVSGTDKLTGAKYRFSNVKTGTDALVTITNRTNGVTISLVDGASGFAEAFQPSITIPAHKSGYIEFTIDFVITGTSILLPQLEVPATPIDVDGQAGTVYEYDLVQLINGYTDFNTIGNELTITFPAGWSQGTNAGGIDYSGIDTGARQVMYTVVNGNISSLIIRVGANNLSGSSQTRLRSIYFKKFIYPSSILPAPVLTLFNGSSLDKQVDLKWTLAADNSIQSVIIERAFDPAHFEAIGQVSVIVHDQVKQYTFIDNNIQRDKIYYRLKLITANGQTQFSKMLAFHLEEAGKVAFSVYPSVITNSANATITAARNQQASLEIVDCNGSTVNRQRINLQQGYNNLTIDGLTGLQRGTYVVLAKLSDMTYSRKVLVR